MHTLTPLNTLDTRFPFGSVVPDGAFLAHYATQLPLLAQYCPFPSQLPLPHPLLHQLETCEQVPDCVPPWWQATLTALSHQWPNQWHLLESLFAPLTPAEFRRGMIEEARWRLWRTRRAGMLAAFPEFPRTPKLDPWLEALAPCLDNELLVKDWFLSRGPQDVPSPLSLVISHAPQWWLNMSNGRGWTSCMDSNGAETRSPQTLGNLYDTGVLLAALVTQADDPWARETLLARVTLRLAFRSTPGTDAVPLVLIGGIYDNDQTSALALLHAVIERLRQHGLAWGVVTGTRTTKLVHFGLCQPLATESSVVQGLPFWIADNDALPYLDGAARWTNLFGESDEGASRNPSAHTPSTDAIAGTWKYCTMRVRLPLASETSVQTSTWTV